MTATLTTPRLAPRGAPSDELIVKCASLSKVFKDFWLRNRVRAVDNITLDVRKGEVFGLLGPNGSGKSTTIKMILGLLHPTSGRIAVFGKRPEDVATKKLLGYLPEESYLYRFLNARETLEYYGRLFHQDRRQRQKRIDMLLEMVGLEAVQRRPVGEYSKGMQRRIGLATALINDPALLILDEPTTGLDPLGTRQIKDLIIRLCEHGKTILLCSHLLSDVEDVCHRVAIMFGGKVRAHGTVDELLTQQDQTMIQTPVLDVQTIQKIEELLEREGKHIERVEQPRQRLEALFLEIVQKAQAEGVHTSGATSGGRIAEFLVDGQVAPAGASGETAAVLAQLMQPQTPAARPEEAKSWDSFPVTPQPEPQPQQAVIDELIADAWKATPEKAPAKAPAAPGNAAAPAPKRSAPQPAAEEQPDQSFIDALTKVEPFENKEPGQSGARQE